jgi:hypothetical protein
MEIHLTFDYAVNLSCIIIDDFAQYKHKKHCVHLNEKKAVEPVRLLVCGGDVVIEGEIV